MSTVLPFGPVQHAEYINAEKKRESTAKARCTLLGRTLRRRLDGSYLLGMLRFATIDEVEDWLDQIRGDGDEAPP